MILDRLAWIAALGALAIGCGNGASGETGGHGGAATSSAPGGAGGATTSVTASSSSSSSSTSSSSSGAGGGPVYEPSGLSCSGAAPSLKNDVVPITTASCSMGVGCHLAAKTANGVYDQFVNRIAEQCSDLRLMIKPGDPERSYLIHKMTNHNICTGQTMPKDQPMLTGTDMQTIYDWICTGAPNN